ncbi:hypothetical protein ACFL9T_01645 [Thermodesulfobacteriota bacterium]
MKALEMNTIKSKLGRPQVIWLVGITALCLGFGQGCGYSFRATGEPLGITIESIAVPLVESTSTDLGFEADVTRVIREEFISRASIPVMPAEKADTVLTAKVYDIKIVPIAFDVQERNVAGTQVSYSVTSTRRLIIRLEAKFTDRRSGKVIWHEPRMREQATFKVDQDPLVTDYNQRMAAERIARRLSIRMFLKTMERF